MKKSFILIIAAIALLTLVDIDAQQTENTEAEKNPFLVEKRHGAVIVVNYNSSVNPSDMVYDRNPFLVEKRHGVVTMVNRNSSSNSVSGNLVADQNTFLAEKRHGAVAYQNSNSLSGTSNPAVEQILFLRQKRHQ